MRSFTGTQQKCVQSVRLRGVHDLFRLLAAHDALAFERLRVERRPEDAHPGALRDCLAAGFFATPAHPVETVSGVLQFRDRERVVLEGLLGAVPHGHLHELEDRPEALREQLARQFLLLARIPTDDRDRLVREVSGSEFDAKLSRYWWNVATCAARPDGRSVSEPRLYSAPGNLSQSGRRDTMYGRASIRMTRSFIWRSSCICCSAYSNDACAVWASKKWISRTRMKDRVIFVS